MIKNCENCQRDYEGHYKSFFCKECKPLIELCRHNLYKSENRYEQEQCFCKKCNKKISWSSGIYGSGLCTHCGRIGRKGLKGEKNPSWKGGKFKDKMGYIFIYNPNHPNAMHNKYVLEHRLIIEKYLGRYLTKKETVHHINGIKDDNRLENLILFKNQSYHSRFRHLHMEEGIIFDGRKLPQSILELEYAI